jgi:cytochrome c553
VSFVGRNSEAYCAAPQEPAHYGLRPNAPYVFAAVVRAASVCLAFGVSFVLAARAQTVEEKAQICSACHGENGIPQDKATPIIAGQHQGYLYLQLRDYKLGARAGEQMAPIAQALERDEMMALAEYFSKQPWPSLRQPPASAQETATALRANAEIGCTGCHLGEYQGDGTQPRIAGQSQEYLAQTMLAFRTRARANNPGMTDLMRATSEAEIAAMAAYLAGR